MNFARPHHNIVVLGDFNVKPKSITGYFMNGKFADIDLLEFPDNKEFVMNECAKLYERFEHEKFK